MEYIRLRYLEVHRNIPQCGTSSSMRRRSPIDIGKNVLGERVASILWSSNLYNICFLNDPTLIVLSSTNSRYYYLCIPPNVQVSCAVVEILKFLQTEAGSCNILVFFCKEQKPCHSLFMPSFIMYTLLSTVSSTF